MVYQVFYPLNLLKLPRSIAIVYLSTEQNIKTVADRINATTDPIYKINYMYSIK